MHLQRSSPGWVVALLAVSTLTHCQLMMYQYGGSGGSGTRNIHVPNRFQAQEDPRGVKQQSAQPGASQPGAWPRRGAVVVTCHADSLEVAVQADLFDTGLLVDGRHLHLGSDPVNMGGACRAFPTGEEEFTIQAHLMDCGTKLSSRNEHLIYSNILVYSPQPSSAGVLRLDGATIPVECHYEKRYALDGIALHPTWVPFVSTAAAEEEIYFNLQLMTDDWHFQRGSHVYFLGDPIHLEVSVILGNHKPLRVYVDRCVATPTPDAEDTLRYDFIGHHGCLADSSLTSSSSHFLPRVKEHKLRFQLDAFRFYQESTNMIYITCYVKAVQAGLAVTSQNRACSFIENRWQSVDGNDQACRSCDLSQGFNEPQSTEPSMTTTWPAKATQDALAWNRPKQHPANYLRIRPRSHQNQPNQPLPSAGVMKRGAESTKTTLLGPLIVLPPTEVVTKPTAPTAVLPRTAPPATVLRKKHISLLLRSEPADTLTEPRGPLRSSGPLGNPTDRKHSRS